MLTVEHVSKSFSKTPAVVDVSFNVPKGMVMGLVGPNGAGKTTLIKCICTILNADSGRIVIDGFDMYEQPVEAKKKIAYIPEVPNPFDYLTVIEHIEFSAKAYLRDDWQQDADRYLQMFGLVGKRYKLVRSLSKGQKQKLQIICAFIHNPQLMFMDEPLIGIDPEGIHALKSLVREFNERGCTFLISSHMLGLVEEMCTDMLIMENGSLIWDGSIADIKEHMQDADLENAFIQITRDYRSSVEEAFKEQQVKPSIFNLFGKRR